MGFFHKKEHKKTEPTKQPKIYAVLFKCDQSNFKEWNRHKISSKFPKKFTELSEIYRNLAINGKCQY